MDSPAHFPMAAAFHPNVVDRINLVNLLFLTEYGPIRQAQLAAYPLLADWTPNFVLKLHMLRFLWHLQNKCSELSLLRQKRLFLVLCPNCRDNTSKQILPSCYGLSYIICFQILWLQVNCLGLCWALHLCCSSETLVCSTHSKRRCIINLHYIFRSDSISQ